MFCPVGSYDKDWGTGVKEGLGFNPSFGCQYVNCSYEVMKGFGFFKSFVAFEGVKFLRRVCSFRHDVLIADVGLCIVAGTISGLKPILSATCLLYVMSPSHSLITVLASYALLSPFGYFLPTPQLWSPLVEGGNFKTMSEGLLCFDPL